MELVHRLGSPSTTVSGHATQQDFAQLTSQRCQPRQLTFSRSLEVCITPDRSTEETQSQSDSSRMGAVTLVSGCWAYSPSRETKPIHEIWRLRPSGFWGLSFAKTSSNFRISGLPGGLQQHFPSMNLT